jgi:hypothetical protein
MPVLAQGADSAQGNGKPFVSYNTHNGKPHLVGVDIPMYWVS